MIRKFPSIVFFVFAGVFLVACKSTPNEKFQKSWYNLRPSVKLPRDAGHPLVDFNKEFVAQLQVADRFGGPEIVWLGDSNVDYANRQRVMKKFDRVAVNFGVGGTTTDDWVLFLTGTKEGQALLKRIKGPGILVVYNVGGNDILQRRNQRTRRNLKKLRGLVGNSLMVAIPPIMTGIISKNTVLSEKEIRAEIEQINGWCARYWNKGRYLDMHTALKDKKTEEFIAGSQRDLIHYSERAFKDVIIPALNQLAGVFLGPISK